MKVLLVDRFQQHRHRSLDDLVLERRLADRALSPVVLLDPDALYGRRLVASTAQTLVQVAQVLVEVLGILLAPSPHRSPAALDLLVWRYASRSKSSSIRWARVVNTRSGSRAACAAMRWSVGVTVGDLNVSPVCPVQLHVMPGVAFPPVGRLGLASPPSPVLCSAKTATLPVSGRFARRSLPDTLPASVRSWCPLRARGRVEAPRPRQGLWSPGPPIRECCKETGGSPKFPSYPSEYMPRSQTPVVSCGTRPVRTQDCCLPATGNRRLSPPYRLEGYPTVHDYTHFGAQSRGLPPRSLQLRTPIAGRCTWSSLPDLLARRWSGGT